jgi:hypothetical protein
MNTQIEAGLRVTVSAALAALLTALVLTGIGHGTEVGAQRAIAAEAQLAAQWDRLIGSQPAPPATAQTHAV